MYSNNTGQSQANNRAHTVRKSPARRAVVVARLYGIRVTMIRQMHVVHTLGTFASRKVVTRAVHAHSKIL